MILRFGRLSIFGRDNETHIRVQASAAHEPAYVQTVNDHKSSQQKILRSLEEWDKNYCPSGSNTRSNTSNTDITTESKSNTSYTDMGHSLTTESYNDQERKRKGCGHERSSDAEARTSSHGKHLTHVHGLQKGTDEFEACLIGNFKEFRPARAVFTMKRDIGTDPAVEEREEDELRLTGLFARLQQGKISVENANIELIRITDDLDKAANNCKSSLETVIMENKKLRQQNQGLHKDAYNKQEQILRLQSKTLKLESERNEALTELAELKKWTEDDDTVLLDASGGVLDASRDVLDASREVLDASRDVLDASADVSGDVMDASGDISGDVLDASGYVSGDVLDASEDVSGDVLDASGDVSGKVLDASGDVLDASAL
ncbi:hypothetical protein MAR_017327 [Mya arenaria]|uniref:Uncharacterized protein n=1 Tax=Mya arenaria TaxID=6604 RepID=A0ABY7EG18_MYAAR|nr:hypothetical protein MAR_017327 [Mya arenaria]